jgi:hypothetical protein
MYPNIEGFIEQATPGEVDTLFASVRSRLDAVKGPKADHARKAIAAIDQAHELLVYLLQIRERLSAEREPRKPKK